MGPTALPGRPTKRSRKPRKTFWQRFYKFWIYDTVSQFNSLFLAVVLWYSLGVISIGTSKMLLKDHQTPPLWLTFQQLLIGSSILRLLLMKGKNGVQPIPMPTDDVQEAQQRARPILGMRRQAHRQQPVIPYHPSLLLTGVYFSLGFLLTNFGFSAGSAAFVETVKAAEPLTSAIVAVGWGIEILSSKEVISLVFLIGGVLLSTVGNLRTGDDGDATSSSTAFSDSVRACLIVMAANLCFSFRGLYQKLLRQSGQNQLDDLNLQFRMQQLGVGMLILPVLFFDTPIIFRGLYAHESIIRSSGRYIGISILNGIAFTTYNLASTFILSRISVVHHATLNCIRRIFAIIVTSIFFQIPISFLMAFGILVSVISFLSFTHYKVQRQSTPKPLSSLLPVSATS